MVSDADYSVLGATFGSTTNLAADGDEVALSTTVISTFM